MPPFLCVDRSYIERGQFADVQTVIEQQTHQEGIAPSLGRVGLVI